jgi:hypothetical protein
MYLSYQQFWNCRVKQSETVRKGHMYMYNILLRMTDTMISQDSNLSSWDILYIAPSYLVNVYR